MILVFLDGGGTVDRRLSIVARDEYDVGQAFPILKPRLESLNSAVLFGIGAEVLLVGISLCPSARITACSDRSTRSQEEAILKLE